MSDETITFSKAHKYGGHSFAKGDKLTLPVKRADLLRAAGVVAKEKKADK